MTNEEAIKSLKKLKSFHNGSYGTAINLAIKTLEQIELNPSYNGVKSELEQRWIPVSERLPEKNGKYLVTVRNGNVYAGVYDAFSGRFQCAATAWMPLPEPYRESEVNTDEN